FLSLIFFLGGKHYLVVRIIQSILGATSCLIIYFLGKEIFPRRVAIIAAIIATFYYPFIQMSAYLVTESVSIFLLLFSFWWLIKSKEDNLFWSLILSGILLGLAGLTRSTFFGFYPLIPLIFVLTSHSKKEGLKQGVLIFIGIALVLLPWVTRNYLDFHKFIPISTRTGYVLYIGNNQMATGDSGGWWPQGREYVVPHKVFLMTEIEKSSYLGAEAKKFIKNNPKRFLDLFFKKVANMWRPYYSGTSRLSQIVMIFSYIPLMILGISGIFLSYKTWRKTIVLVLFILYYVLIHAILVATIRYRWPTMPFFFIFAGFTLTQIREKFRTTPQWLKKIKLAFI
ncbi:glycosyltransferase family 39 protein, partial [bacterium]|nr:glycosyltransferase family 39 protein [bacterium]